MLTFDKVPVMDREAFDDALARAKSFAVWVQVNPALQRLVPISREDAIDIANDGMKIMPIWGQLSHSGCLELSITSQWLARLEELTPRQQAYKTELVKYLNKQIGTPFADERLMRPMEEVHRIPEQGADDFRRSFAAACYLNGEKATYDKWFPDPT